MKGPTRRSFLGMLGGVTGAALVTGSGLAGPAAATGIASVSLPSGYAFRRVFVPGQLAGKIGRVATLTPAAMVNDAGLVLVHAKKEDGRRGVYALQLGGTPATVFDAWTVVEEGQRLHDGALVSRIYCGDISPSGSYVTVIGSKGKPPAVYRARHGQPMRRVVQFHDPLPHGHGHFGGHFGDVDIDDQDHVVLVAAYTTKSATHQGLFHIPGGHVGPDTRLLLHTGQMVPGTDSVLTGFGLVDNSGDRFVVQATARTPQQMRDRNLRVEPTVVMRGDLHRPAGKLLAASSVLSAGGGPVAGDSLIGSRIGRQGTVAHVAHESGGRVSLYTQTTGRSQLLSTTGQLSGGGPALTSLSPGTLGPRDLLYYRRIFAGGAMTMVVTNGTSSTPLLSTGDRVGGWAVGASYFGFHPEQVDRRGRAAFIAQFPGKAPCLVLGEPF